MSSKNKQTKPQKNVEQRFQKKKAQKQAAKEYNKPARAAIKNELRVGLSELSLRDRAASEKVARSIAIPASYPVERFSSEFTTMETAIASPWAVENANFDSSTTSEPGAQISRDLMFAFVFRNALRASVQYDANSGALNWGYVLTGTAATAGNPTTTIPVAATQPNVIQPIHAVWAAADITLGNYQPHGARYYPGKDGESSDRYFWIDATPFRQTQVTVLLASAPGAGQGITVYVKKWSDLGAQQFVTILVQASSTSATFNFNASGYYSFAYATISPSFLANSLTISWVGSSSVWRHLALPGMDANALAVDGMRIQAMSLMYTNRASDLNRQGQICLYQVPQDILWDELAVSFNEVSSSQGAKTLIADKGGYLFAKPTQPSDFDMQTPFEAFGASIRDAGFYLQNKNDYLCIALQITNDQGGRDGYFTRAYGIEYRTDDVWRECATGGDAKCFQEGLMLLKGLQQYHENPLHWAEIWDGIKKAAGSVASVVAKYGVPAAKVASLLI